MVQLSLQIGIAAAAFALGSAIAELFGAANLGTAFGFGEIAFALTAAYLIVRT